MPVKTYDAIVIGSGITGGWAAKELTEKGLETLVLEAGRPIEPNKDYVEHVPVWQKKFRDMGDRNRSTTSNLSSRMRRTLDELNSKFLSTTNRILHYRRK